jgi:radical SAM superfamily enzyme YgiQ (UPF0313 family)
MKILLLMPQSEMYRQSGIFSRSLRYAPLTLTTLAALVPEELNADVRVLDEGVEPLEIEQIDADLVGITCITPNAPRVYRIAAELRARGITVVLGGVHPTLVPEEAQPHGDAIVTGYAEQSWPRLLRDFAAGRLQPRYDEGPDYRFAGMPEPRRDLLRKEGYITINTVQAVRGCPYRCNFCVVPVAWPGYLHRPVPEVIAEIERLEGKTFLFLDLSPIEDVRYIKELYRALVPLNKRWGGLATIRITRDRELLKLAARSGCGGLLIGFESVVPETIRQMNKGFNHPDEYLDAVRLLHDQGIAVNGCFVFGLDGDDRNIFEQTVEFVDRAAIDLPRFSVATPFPGTPLFRQVAAEDRLITRDWTYYGGQNVVFRPRQMSVEQLQEGLRWSWRHAYRLPSIVRRITGSAASRSGLVLKTSVLANLGYTRYARLLPDYVPVPCEVEPWNTPPELALPLAVGERG